MGGNFQRASNTANTNNETGYAQFLNQYADILSGLYDAGDLALCPPAAAPSHALTLNLNGGSTGNLNGTYNWGYYWVTGVYSGLDATQTPAGYPVITGRTVGGTLTAQQAGYTPGAGGYQKLSIPNAQTVPPGVVGWGLLRNINGTPGTLYIVPGTELYLSAAGVLPTGPVIDGLADSALNYTGTVSTGTAGSTTLYLVDPGTAPTNGAVLTLDPGGPRDEMVVVLSSVFHAGTPNLYICTLQYPLVYTHQSNLDTFTSNPPASNTTGTCLTGRCGFDFYAEANGAAWSQDVQYHWPFSAAPGSVTLTPDGGSPSNCAASVVLKDRYGFVLVLTATTGAQHAYWHGTWTVGA